MRLKFRQNNIDVVIAVTNVHYYKHVDSEGNYKEGLSVLLQDVPQVLAKTIESVKETTGFDLTEVMKANTYDAKVNNNINVATDFGEKLAENATKETVDEMKTAPIAKPSKRRVNVTPENKQ